MQTVGEALGRSHQSRGARVFADADEDAFARRPWPGNGTGLHLGTQLFIDPVGSAPQGQFAQRRQVCRRKEMLKRTLGLLGYIDLAFLEALDQVVGRQVDQFDGVGAGAGVHVRETVPIQFSIAPTPSNWSI